MSTGIPGRMRSPRRTHRPVLAAALAGTLSLGGCVAYQDIGDEQMAKLPPIDLQPTPAPTPPPVGIAGLVITNLREEPAADPSLVRLTGIIVNQSKQDAVRLQVRVEARDGLGRVLSRVVVPALNDVIPPNTSSSFEASLPRSPSIHDYHAEIVAR
ncbi:MAG: hypothetical protein FJ148_18850 [Deltaproteobacteria bacterium]|nr:hypothetical protein [Deltaproteobacteria bacterium]